MSDEQTQDVVEAQQEAYDEVDAGQSVEEVAAGLAAALRSGNSQDSEAALRNYDALALDEDGFDLGLGPAKRSLGPQEAADNAEVGGGTDDDIEAAAFNALDGSASTTIEAHGESNLTESAQDVSDVEPADEAAEADEADAAIADEAVVSEDEGEPGDDPDDEASAPFNPSV